MTDRRTIRGVPAAGRPGWTLLECLLVVAIMAVLCAAAVPLLHAGRGTFEAVEPRVLMAQEARAALAHAASALRQARAVTAVTTGNGSGTASLQFIAGDGTTTAFGRDASNQIYFGPPASTAVLAKNCTALSIQCYRADAQPLAAPLTDPTGVVTADISATVADPKGRGTPETFTTRVGLLRTPPSVIINEIMYSAPSSLGGSGYSTQWIELYNASSAPVDVGGWSIWAKNQDPPDALQADALYCSGSTVIPPGGYALVTGQQSKLYQEALANGGFESTDMSKWKFSPPGTWQRTAGGAMCGTYKVQITGGALTTMYQDFKINASCQKARLLVRARMAQGSPAGSSLAIRITDRGPNTLVSVYNGPLAGAWTTYAADLTAVVDRDARLEIKVNSPSGTDLMFIDGTAVYGTTFPTHPLDCQHIWVNDSRIGGDIGLGQVFLSQGRDLRNVVAWSTAWGGNADGTSLSRVSPFAPSTEQSSWKPGPYAGTPAAPN